MRVLTDKVLFAGKPTPGIAYVEPITVEASYETREIPLKAGRNYVFKGLEPVSTTITCTLYDDQDLADCRAFIQYVRPSIDNSNTVNTWDIQHPSLGGISEFVIKSLTYPRPQKNTTYIFVIKIEEFREPEAALKKVGSDGKIDPYSAITATGEAEAGSATESLAISEKTAALKDQERRKEVARRELAAAEGRF